MSIDLIDVRLHFHCLHSIDVYGMVGVQISVNRIDGMGPFLGDDKRRNEVRKCKKYTKAKKNSLS